MDAKAMLAEAQSALTDARHAVTKYEQLVMILTELVSPGVGSLEPDTASRVDAPRDETAEQLKPKAAILKWMRAHSDSPLSPKEIYDGLREQGLTNPRIASGSNAYTTALRRLSQDERIPVVQTVDGLYMYQSSSGLLDTSLEYPSLPQSSTADERDAGEGEKF